MKYKLFAYFLLLPALTFADAASARVLIESNLVLPADSPAPVVHRDHIKNMPLVTAEGQYVALPIAELSLEQLGSLTTSAGGDVSLADAVAVPSATSTTHVATLNNLPTSVMTYTYSSGSGVTSTIPNTNPGVVQNSINNINRAGSGGAVSGGAVMPSGGAIPSGSGAGGAMPGGI